MDLNSIQLDCLCRVATGQTPTERQRQEFTALVQCGLIKRCFINRQLTPWVDITDLGRELLAGNCSPRLVAVVVNDAMDRKSLRRRVGSGTRSVSRETKTCVEPDDRLLGELAEACEFSGIAVPR